MTLSPSLLNSDLAQTLADSYPPLARYVPASIFNQVSLPQAVFLLDEGRENLYGGAVGGGKSAALLMGALQYVDVPGYAALLLRRTFSELSKAGGLIPLSIEWLGPTDAKWSATNKTWTFPSGATIEFGHVKNETNKTDYQGAAYSYVGFDELTHFSETIYDYIGFSRQRRLTGTDVPVRTRSSANPGGVGHLWVKRKFITNRKPDVLFIPAKIGDNPGLDVDDYRASLAHLPEDLRRQLMEGDWDAFEGASFADFDEAVHCVPAFPVPDGWERFESLDHGLGNPTCVLGWAADYDGNLITFDSYYSERDKLISDHAAALVEKRKWWWPAGSHPVCHADHDLWEKTGNTDSWDNPATHVSQYLEGGIGGFVQAVKKRGAGRGRMLELLKPEPDRPFPGWHPRHGEKGAPRWFIVGERCPELVEQLKGAPTNAEPVTRYGPGEITDPAWERDHGHATAAARYGAMTWKRPSVEKREPDFLAPALSREELMVLAAQKVERKRNPPPGRKRYRLT